MSKILEAYAKHFLLLLEAGFVAIKRSDEDSAIKLFTAAEKLQPTNVMPKIGFGYLYLCKLELKKSIDHLEQALKMEPENELAKSILGIAYSFTPEGKIKGEQLLTQISKKSSSSEIQKLSDSALTFVNTFIKKSPPKREDKELKQKNSHV